MRVAGVEQVGSPRVHEVLDAVEGDQVRPPRQVLDGCGPVAAEVAPGPLTERFLALRAPWVRNPLIDEHDQLLALAHQSEAQGPGLRRRHAMPGAVDVRHQPSTERGQLESNFDHQGSGGKPLVTPSPILW